MVDLVPPAPAQPVRQPLTALAFSWFVILSPTIALVIIALAVASVVPGPVR